MFYNLVNFENNIVNYAYEINIFECDHYIL